MKITIETKWIEPLEDFDIETKVAIYEAIFAYLCGSDVKLSATHDAMFKMIRPMLDEERNRRSRLAERSRENGKKGGRKKPRKEPKLIEVEEYRSDDLKSLDKWMADKTPYIYANIRHINQKEFEALKGKYTSAEICDTLQQIENRKDLRKKYTNLYRTLLNWLKK